MYNPTKPYKHDILRLIESTWRTPYVRVQRGIYPILTKKFSFSEIQHSDGIGTKGIYHLRKRTFKEAVVDAFAMNVNDMAMMGAVPYSLQDHIVTPEKGDKAVLEIIRALVALCRTHKVAITGGETSHHDNIDAIDISVSMSGFVKKMRTNQCKVGDVLIGLRSNGLHANGFTRVRGLFGAKEWRDDFTRPTALYLDTVHRILKQHSVHAMMHITGGAFSKLKDILGKNDARIMFPRAFKPRDIFYELHARGVSDRDMYATFNCGIGFVLSVPADEAVSVLRSTPKAVRIGVVEEGKGNVHIQSVFSGVGVRL